MLRLASFHRRCQPQCMGICVFAPRQVWVLSIDKSLQLNETRHEHMKRQELSFRYPQSCQSCGVACYIHHAKRIYWQSPASNIMPHRMNNNNTWHYFLSWICAFENVDMRESGIFHSLCHLLNINCMLSLIILYHFDQWFEC